MVLSMLQHAWSPKVERSEDQKEFSERRPSSTELTILMAGRNPWRMHMNYIWLVSNRHAAAALDGLVQACMHHSVLPIRMHRCLAYPSMSFNDPVWAVWTCSQRPGPVIISRWDSWRWRHRSTCCHSGRNPKEFKSLQEPRQVRNPHLWKFHASFVCRSIVVDRLVARSRGRLDGRSIARSLGRSFGGSIARSLGRSLGRYSICCWCFGQLLRYQRQIAPVKHGNITQLINHHFMLGATYLLLYPS